MKSHLTLDHFFCFTSPDVPELEVLGKNGFVFTRENLHQGQGTGMRGIIFEENYLEFIYLRSRDESLNNQLKLYRRAEWQQSGACPYGIGLRGVVSPEDRELFCEYRPPYRPTGSILIHKINETDPSYPLIFVMEPTPERPLDSMKPIKWNKDENFLSFLRHRSKTTKIADLEIHCTSRNVWPLPFFVNNLSVISGAPKFSSTLRLDGNIGEEAIEANSLVTLAQGE